MSRQAAVFIVLAAAAAFPIGAQERGVRAAELTLARLEQALDDAAARPAGVAGAEAELRPLAADLLARIDARRESFRTVAGQALPAKAAARLAQAEAAFEAGQGRLQRILSELVLTPAGDDATARFEPAARRERASLAREAREILARLELASRPEPLSSELKLRAPSLRAPALPAAITAPEAPERAAEAPAAAALPIGVVPPELQNLADQLAGPFEVYAWVRRNVAPEIYYGAAKGALAVSRDQRGNDADSAALLALLLRAKGVPARLVIGTAEIPADTLRRMVGVEGSVEDAVRVLERAGIPNEPVTGPGGLSSVKIARVWVEAYVPYVNYRGLDLDPQGKAWVPLDAAFQLFAPAGGVDVVGELGFDPRAAWDEYMQAPRAQTPLEFVRGQVEALLQAQRPGTSYTDALAHRETEAEALGILPNTLPYVATVAERVFDLPATLTHTLHLVGKFQGTTVIDATFPAGELIGRTVTLSYAPFSEEDAAVVALFGGMYQTPPYLFEVRPVISLDGVEAAAGSAPVGFGVKYGLELELRTPAGSENVANTILAGNLTALAVAGGDNQLVPLPNDAAGRILSGLATRYLARWNAADDEWARLLRVVAVRPTLSAAFLMSAVEVDYAGGDPLYPLSFDWKGVDVDADFRPLAPVGIEHREREAAFALLSGLQGSVLEARVLADDLQVASMSTVGAIQSAYAQAIPVLDVTRDNAEAIVPGLPFDATVKAEVLDAALRGRLVRIPSAPVSDLAWTGVGYVVLDEETGEAAYQLQGGHSGGTTTPAVNELPTRWSLPLRGYGVGALFCSGPPPFKVEMKSDDNQFGLVNQKLDKPLKVLVLDSRSRPLKNACVTFSVVGGGGRLVGLSGLEDTSVTVFSDSYGMAMADLRLGEHTKDLPGFWCEDGRTCGPGQDEYTQVGFNVVAVRAGAAIMPGTFTHFAKPDPNCNQGGMCQTTVELTTPPQRGGAFNLQIGGLMGVRVTDAYKNPVSNVKVRFRFNTVTLSPEPSGWYRTRGLSSSAEAPGLVLKPKSYLDCIASNPNPGRHDCPGEAPEQELPSGPFGVYAYSVIGDSTYSDYAYEISATGTTPKPKATFSTAGWLCSVPDVHACGLDWPQTIVTTTTRARRVNAAGNFIEAYPTGGNGDLTVAAHVLEEQQEPPPDSPQSDSCGPIYRARGNNAWKRKPLTNSTFTLSAATAGTGVPGSAGPVGNGVYRAQMTMAATPQENRAGIQSKHFPGVVHRLQNCGNDDDRVDPARSPVVTVDGARQFQRTPEPPSRPWQGSFEFPLWGAQVKIDKVEPQPSYVTEEGRTTHPTLVRHKILPDAWRKLLDPVQVYFKVAKAGGAPIVEGTGNMGEVFTIGRDLPMPADTYEARLEVQSVNLDGGKIEATPAQVRTAVANFLLDLNNDTVVDDRDAEEARRNPGAAFGFWEADSQLEGQRRLQDYATLVVRLPEAPAPEEQLSIRLDAAGTAFVMVPKLGGSASGRCPADKAYLCNADAAAAQWALAQSGSLRSSDGAVMLPTSQLRSGDNAFLFRCDPGMLDVASCFGKVMTLERRIADNPAAVIDRGVDIRSPRQWMSAVTVRQPFVPTEAGADVSALPGWADIPDDARRIFVFAHGYNVNAGGAQSNWFPLLLKRFYWAGLPMLSVQGTATNGRPHFVGLTWPGDQAVTEFGVDEFNALQSGVPIGLFLARNLSGREVRVMAHSLGNMAVSSALSLIPGGTVKYFVMNDAAVPAEAFSNAYVPDGLETAVMRPEAAEHGYPNDDAPPGENWEEQWQSMNAHPNRPDLTCLYTPLPLRPPLSKWNANLAAMNPNLMPRPQYNIRYRQFGLNGTQRLGPWVGLFSRASQGTQLINTYNPFDDVVRIDDGVGSGVALHYWFLAQSLQKPFSGWILGTTPNDGNCVQYWGRLQENDVSLAAENDLWSVGRSAGVLGAPSAQQRARMTRRWGELTYWFTPLSGGAGTQALRGVAGGVRNMEFAHARGGRLGFDSHSYMNEFPFDEVWNHYVDLADILK